MYPTTNALGAGVSARGAGLVRALDIAVRVMADANERMAQSVVADDDAGWEQASLRYDAAEQRYDELCAAAEEVGYLAGFATVPEKPAKAARPARRDRLAGRFLGRVLARVRGLRAVTAH